MVILHTLSLSLPSHNHNSIDLSLGTQVDHEDRLVHVVVVHDGAVGKVGILFSINSQGAVTIFPLFPSVSFVIDPSWALECLIGN